MRIAEARKKKIYWTCRFVSNAKKNTLSSQANYFGTHNNMWVFFFLFLCHSNSFRIEHSSLTYITYIVQYTICMCDAEKCCAVIAVCPSVDNPMMETKSMRSYISVCGAAVGTASIACSTYRITANKPKKSLNSEQCQCVCFIASANEQLDRISQKNRPGQTQLQRHHSEHSAYWAYITCVRCVCECVINIKLSSNNWILKLSIFRAMNSVCSYVLCCLMTEHCKHYAHTSSSQPATHCVWGSFARVTHVFFFFQPTTNRRKKNTPENSWQRKNNFC